MTDLELAARLFDDGRFQRCFQYWPLNVNGYTGGAVVAEYMAAARREGAEAERAMWEEGIAQVQHDAYDRGAEEMRERVTNDVTRENIVRVIRRCFGAYDQANGVPEEVANRVLECIAALSLTPEEPT